MLTCLLVSIFLLPVRPSDWFQLFDAPWFKVLYQAQEQSKHGSKARGWRILNHHCRHCATGWSRTFSPGGSLSTRIQLRMSFNKGCRHKVICGILQTNGLTLISYPDSWWFLHIVDPCGYKCLHRRMHPNRNANKELIGSRCKWKRLNKSGFQNPPFASFLGVLDLSWYFLGWSSEQFLRLELFDILQGLMTAASFWERDHVSNSTGSGLVHASISSPLYL